MRNIQEIKNEALVDEMEYKKCRMREIRHLTKDKVKVKRKI